MTEFDGWLENATRRLSKGSALKVRAEIEEHYELAKETAINHGAEGDEAGRIALRDLGGAGEANCAYRKVLLTAAEAASLCESNLEARAICSRPWLKWTALSLPGALLVISVAALLMHQDGVATGSLLAGLLMAIAFIVPFLPVYTIKRGRIVRGIRWAVMICAMALLFERNAMQWSWLLAPCFWPMIRTEWTRTSIRRKLPVAEWPKQLYL